MKKNLILALVMKKLNILLLTLMLCIGLTATANAATITPSKPAGSGTEASPYLIGTAAELYWFAENYNNKQISQYAYAKLTNDIVVNAKVFENGSLVSNTSSLTAWMPIGTGNYSFRGVFDGDNYTISGLYVNETLSSQGLLGYSIGQIKNLTIADSYFKTTGGSIGAFVGYGEAASISNCHTLNCIITGNSQVGGIAGSNVNNARTFTNCTNKSEVICTGSFAGGIVGNSDSYITNCTNYGKISGEVGIGGIVGYGEAKVTSSNTQRIEDCTNKGIVTASLSSAGGIIGAASNKYELTNCHNEAEISGAQCVGGIDGGAAEIECTGCYNTGNITGSSKWTAGIVGYTSVSTTLSACYNTGNVTATGTNATQFGGLVGYSARGIVISKSYNTGDITGDSTSTYLGGLIGVLGSSSSSRITNSYNIGNVTGGAHVGGIAGRANFTINKCYNAGSISGSGDIGGIVGKNTTTSTITNSYYLSSCAPYGNDVGTALTAAQMTSDSAWTTNYAGFDTTFWSKQSPNTGDKYYLPKLDAYSPYLEITFNTVTIANGISNGSVTADVTSAAAGEKVTLSSTPADGYLLDKYTVTDANGNAVTVTNNVFTMPASNVTVTATFKIIHTHKPCGDSTCDSNHPIHSAVGYTAVGSVSDLQNLSSGNHYYYLSQNITTQNMIHVDSGETLYLCLNGHSITANMGAGASLYSVFYVGEGGKLVLCDCQNSDNSIITSRNTCRGIEIYKGTVELYGGNITGNTVGDSKTTANGGGMYINGGSCTMYGGSISNNKTGYASARGGGVCVAEGAKFTMYGGTISGNTSNYGGGICKVDIGTASKITIKGGTITNNTANESGGGIAVFESQPGSFVDLDISGGSIANNTAGKSGGGIYNYYCRTEISGGTITANTVSGTSGWGGGIANDNGILVLKDCSITGNKASSGGGVTAGNLRVYVGGNVTITDNTNLNNSANNVYLWGKTAYRSAGYINVTAPLTGQINFYTADIPTETSPVRYLCSTDTYTITANDLRQTAADRTYELFQVKNIDREHYGIFGYEQYKVAVATAENGKVTASPSSAAAGKSIGLTIEPDTGYEPDIVKVYDADGKSVAVSADYKFTMPSSDVTVEATFKLKQYTIKFVNEDGTVLQSGEAAYGETPVYTGDTPAKATDAQYTYTFAGWSPAIAPVTGEATYKATYTSTVNQYPIKFVNEDGTVLQSGEVAYGETPVYTGETPVKAATAQYTYTFAGWTPEISAVTGEATYTAIFSNGTNTYTVTWVDEDGTTILEKDEDVPYGTMPSFEAAEPTKATDAQYTYAFSGWTPAIAEVTGNATYKATYTSAVNKYTIKFVNEDGTVLQSGEVAYGETPVYTGETPVKAADAQYTYTFAGWTPAVAKVTGSATYKATYTSTVNKYTVKFVNEDGTVLQSGEVAYGETPVYTGVTPVKAADAQYTYTFAGWSPAVAKVTVSATYTATFSNNTNSYTVTWQNEAGELIDAESVEYGGSATKSPAVPDKLGYTGKWNHDGKNIVQNTIIKPEYTANQYTLTFNTAGGSTIAPITQAFGSVVTAPAAPTKEGWTFQGWDKKLPATMPAENLTLTATWIPATQLKAFSLSADELWLHRNQTHQLELTGLDPQDAICEFVWTSSDPAILTVNNSGLLTASGTGTAVLTVTEKWSGLSQSCTVHIVSPVTGISFAESNLQMIPGDTRQLTATVTCPEESVTNQLVTFSPSNKSVATVDENGVVTAIAEGTVTITATAANGVSATCTINVLLLGDANNDGKVDVADVLIILQDSAGWDVTVNPAKADVTGDGTIGISDALKILQDCMGGDIVQAMRTLQRMLADLNASSLEITGQPVDQRVTAGETAAFTVTATGDALQYQWYIDRNDGKGWQKLNNAVEATYVTSKADADNDGYQYRCVVTDAHGAEATTASAVLHVVLDLPNTGDASMPALWLTMCLLSGVGLMLLRRKKTLR